jgi:hypothetical protein
LYDIRCNITHFLSPVSMKKGKQWYSIVFSNGDERVLSDENKQIYEDCKVVVITPLSLFLFVIEWAMSMRETMEKWENKQFQRISYKIKKEAGIDFKKWDNTMIDSMME